MNDDAGPLLTDLLTELRTQFADAGIEDPEVDAELIVGHVLGESRGRIQALAIMGRTLTGGAARPRGGTC